MRSHSRLASGLAFPLIVSGLVLGCSGGGHSGGGGSASSVSGVTSGSTTASATSSTTTTAALPPAQAPANLATGPAVVIDPSGSGAFFDLPWPLDWRTGGAG